MQQICGCIGILGNSIFATWGNANLPPLFIRKRVYNRKFAASNSTNLQHIYGCIPIMSKPDMRYLETSARPPEYAKGIAGGTGATPICRR